MDFAQQAFINDGFGHYKLVGVTALETNAGFNSCRFDGFVHCAQILQ
jgi:hypothetical protein